MTVTEKEVDRQELAVVLGPIDLDPPPCVLCEGEMGFDAPLVVHIIVRGKGRICETCTGRHAPSGWWDLCKSLDAFDTALMNAPTVERSVMAEMFADAAGKLVARHSGRIKLKPGNIVALSPGLRFGINKDTTSDNVQKAAVKARANGYLEIADALDELVPIFEDETARSMWFENA